MHEIDMMLKLQLEGKHKEARILSDKLEAIGADKILDAQGKNTQDIWFRHCFNRGWFKIQDGEYQAGCRLLEHGRFLNVYGSPPLKTDAPIFNPDMHDIRGKSIIVSLEGGYGDEIIHARFATVFKKRGASHVYIAAAPELVPVFQRIQGVDGVILRNQAHTVKHDFWVPGFSAGWLSGCTFEDFPGDPYLTPKMESIEIWKNFVKSDKIKVGIRWAGNPKFEHQQFRRFPINFVTNLTKYEELEIYSLQRDHNTITVPAGVHDLQHFLLGWEDTMAAIANLDIVISSCTSIAHLAAAMGKETWVIVPVLPYHTWTPGSPDKDTSPYYKCVKLFRQKAPNKWNDTFQDLYTALEKRFNLKHVDMPDEDRVTKRLNMGCGYKKIENFVNVDRNAKVKPDIEMDFNTFPWNFKDDEFDHIFAKDILEYIGENKTDLVKTIKEMYRISANGAIWEIQIPHWRCDSALDNPDYKHVITTGFFQQFNKRAAFDRAQAGDLGSLVSFEHDIDIEICDVQFDYTLPWQQRIKTSKVSQEELSHALNHLNNVAQSTRVLIQVHKPARIDTAEFQRALDAQGS